MTTSMNDTYEYIIVGAGLAGMAMAEALLEQGVAGTDICILDAGDAQGAGASGGPGFLLNPLPGRSLVPKPGYLEAFAMAGPWLQRLQQRCQHYLSRDCLFQGELLRLLLDQHKVSRRLERSYIRAREVLSECIDPPLSLRELNADETQERCPQLAANTRAILIQPSYALWPQPALLAQRKWLQEQHVSLHWSQQVIEQTKEASQWHIRTQQGVYAAQKVILAMGAFSEALAGLPEEEERVGGALLVLRPPSGQTLQYTLSGVGIHVAPRPDGCWVVGATYEAPGQPILSDAQSISSLLDKAAVYLPDIHDAEVVELWRGKRLILPQTRMPFVGPAPGPSARWVLGAFGSKGLLMIYGSAHQLAAQYVVGTTA